MFYDTFLNLCNAKKEKPTPVLSKLGISTGSISNWQQNKTVPSGDTLAKIADYFDVSVDYLLGREEQKEKPTDDFPVSFEDFSAGIKNKERAAKIAELSPKKQKFLFDSIDEILKNLEKL